MRVGAALHGPLGSGTRAVRDVPLDAKSIADRYPLVDDVPEVISQRMGVAPADPEAVVTIR